jgi:hypothetical protein
VVNADVDAAAAGGVDQTATGCSVAVDVAHVAIGWVGVLWKLVYCLFVDNVDNVDNGNWIGHTVKKLNLSKNESVEP